MPKYLFQASYTPEGVKGLIKDTASGRRSALKAALKGVGAKLDSMHFTFGSDDVIEISEGRLGYLRDDTVVDTVSSQPVDLLDGEVPHRHARPLGLSDKLLMARRLFASHADIPYPLRVGTDRLQDGIDSVDDHVARASRIAISGPS